MASEQSRRFVPPVMWAQRLDRVYLTINLEDVENPEIKLEETQLYFRGKGGIEKKEYEVTVEFYGEVNPQESKYGVLPRNIPMVIKKKAGSAFWPRLLKEKGKKHWLKTDFERWKDEDDSDQGEEKQDFQLEDMMQQMGNFNAGDAGGGKAMDAEEDSDDEELPDLEDNTTENSEADSKNKATNETDEQKS